MIMFKYYMFFYSFRIFDLDNDKILFITKTLGTTEQEPEEVLEFLECADLFDAIPNTIKPAPKNNIKLYKYQ